MTGRGAAGTAVGGQDWAALMRGGANPGGVAAVISAVNGVTAARRANAGAVMVACAQVLAQCIVAAGPGPAAQVRSGIAALIDGFATEVAAGDGR